MPKHSDYHISQFTGRRRKLSDGVMTDITKLFAEGIPVREICEAYDVSPNVVYSICYWTPRKRDIERLQEGGSK